MPFALPELVIPMRRVFAVLLLAFTAAAARPADPPPAPQTFRTALVSGDVDRSWTIVWSRGGTLDLDYDLLQNKKVATVASTAVSFEEYEDGAYYGRFDLPDGTKPGVYTLDTGGGVVNLTVTAALIRRTATVQPGLASATEIDKLLRLGYRDITLAPGRHDWNGPVAFPADTRLWGYGAFVRRVGAVDYNYRSIIPAGPNVSVYGVTWVYDVAGQVFHCDPVQPGLVVSDCTFRRCNFGYGPTDVLVKYCRFESGGAVIAPPGLWYRNTFVGPPAQTAFMYWGGGNYAGRHLAMIDDVFDGTDRGPCFLAAAGPVSDNLFVGTACRNINGTGNRNELFACEGSQGFDRNLFFHTSVTGCSGGLFQLAGNSDGVARNNLIRHLKCDGGYGFLWWGADVSGNEVQYFELLGAGIRLTNGATNNTFSDGVISGWVPKQHDLGQGRPGAIWEDGPNAGTNRLSRVVVGPVPAPAAK